MSAIFQATADVEDVERFRAAIEWLQHGVEHPPGFVSLRVFQDSADPKRLTLVEEWTSQDAFMTSLREQGPAAGPEFLARAGVAVDAFASTLWTASGIATIVP